MYKIDLLHKLPDKKTINANFFFNKYKVNNDFFEKDIFLTLSNIKKEYRIKSENEAYTHNELICVRKSEELTPNYTLPSIYISINNLEECQSIIQDYLKNNIYNFVHHKDKERIIKILDKLNNKDINANKHINSIIDFVVDFVECKYKYNEKIFLDTFLELYATPSCSISFKKLIELYETNFYINNKEELDNKFQKSIQKTLIVKNKNKFSTKINKKEKKILKDKRNIIINNAKNNFINKKIDIIKLFNSKVQSQLLMTFENLINTCLTNNIIKNNEYEKIIDDKINSFFNIKKENLIFIKKNNIKLINIKLIKTKKTKEAIKHINSEINSKIEVLSLQQNNYTKKYNFKTLNKTFFSFSVSLDKRKYKIEEFKEITDYIEKENINKLIRRLIEKQLTKKNQDFINFLFNENYENNKISIKITNNTQFREKIKVIINDSLINKIIKPNSETHLKNYKIKQSKVFKIYKKLFPKARNRKREILYLAGKTNSGKTYQAFEELKKYKNGIYLAPLRLLAIEGQEEIEKRGFNCSLLTGEERRIKEGANFISSTIEMLDTDKVYDVAIIDEIQMINNIYRGDSWLEAFIGVNAKKVIIVGSNDIKDEIYKLSEYLNEEIKYINFERKTPLIIGQHSKFNKKLEPNSAVIAFSKRDLFDLKSHFEDLGNTVSIIYGKLPPNVKINESEKFRRGETEVLVSTDAIGMGLNLPIKKVYFSSISKFDGSNVNELDPSLVKQIAGRAGRFGIFEEGVVSSFSKEHNDYIEMCLNKNTNIDFLNVSTKITLSIFNELLKINKKVKNIPEIIKLSNDVHFDITNVSTNSDYMIIANIINKHSLLLSNKDIVKLLNAPINSDKDNVYIEAFEYLFNSIVESKNKTLNNDDFIELYKYINFKLKFNTYEKKYKLLDLFHFFSFNFKEHKDFEKIIKKYKNNVSKKIMTKISHNINEDDIDYYLGK